MSQDMATTLAIYQFAASLVLPPAIFAIVLLGFWAGRKAAEGVLHAIARIQS